jgi:hypothetical protein
MPIRRKVPATRNKKAESSALRSNHRRRIMELSPFIVPLGAFVMVVIIVAISSMKKMREKELEAHQQLRTQEMEHERRLKEMDIEKAKLEVEKARATKIG